jgi:hypothetical protein
MWIEMESLELESSSGFQPRLDRRPRMDEPLPVKLVAVEDVTLSAPAELEAALDAFYVGLWQFAREADEPGVVYRAENCKLRFEIVADPIARDTLRPQGIEVASLVDAERKLAEDQIEYIRQRGLTPGQETLLLQDPAGNWVEILESRAVG